MEEEAVRRLLTRMLEEAGVPWVEETGLIRFWAEKGGMRWEMNCRCRKGETVVYSRYPFFVTAGREAWTLCGRINARTARGAMLLPEDGRPVFRAWADLRDVYGGEARLRETLTYAARLTARFWGDWEALSHSVSHELSNRRSAGEEAREI